MNHGVEKFMVEKFGFEMSSLHDKVKGQLNSRLFNHELFNPMVQKFMVEKSGVEMSFNQKVSNSKNKKGIPIRK